MNFYQHIQQDFKAWLSTLGYAQSTVYGLPKQVREFLDWLEERNIVPKEITQAQAEAFLAYFKNRPHQRKEGGLSIAHINKQVNAMNKLGRFLHLTGQNPTVFQLKACKKTEKPPRTVLTKAQIQALYQAIEEDEIGQRDKAMLGIYYGGGLRKAEGLALEVDDVLLESKRLYVRKPKNGQERYVPIPEKVVQDLAVYLSQARSLLVNESQPTEKLLISVRGQPLHGESLIARLNVLKQKAGIQQNFGLHALRHSIATHLLQSGMSLENIAAFLGHKTLDSTQHYTHLIP